MTNDRLPDNRLAYSPAEFARAIGVCHKTVVNLINARQLTARRVGRRVIIPKSAADKFLERDHRLPKK